MEAHREALLGDHQDLVVTRRLAHRDELVVFAENPATEPLSLQGLTLLARALPQIKADPRALAPRLAAQFADEFNLPFSSLDDTEAQFGRVRAACIDKGRDPTTLRLSAAQTVCCGANDAEVERRAANIGRKAEDLRAHGLAGTPDEVVARLQQFAAIGAESVYLQVLDLGDLEHIDLLALLIQLRQVEGERGPGSLLGGDRLLSELSRARDPGGE